MIEAPVKPKGMLDQDIDKQMNPDLSNVPMDAKQSSTLLMVKPNAPAVEKPPVSESSKGLLDDLETPISEPAKLVEKPVKSRADQFSELKALREAAEARATTAERELEKARKGGTDAETFRTRAEQAERELEKAALERSPRYQAAYVQKPKELIEQAKELAKEFEVSESTIDQALALNGKPRRDFIDQNFNSGSAVSEITGILHTIDDIFKSRNSELENHKVALEKDFKAQQDELAARGIQTTEARIQKFESLLQNVAEKVGAPFKKTGEAERDSIVESNLKMARSLVDGTATPEDQAVAPYLAVAAREYMRLSKTQAAHISKLEARLKEYGDHEPLGTHAELGSERPSSGGKPMGLLEKAKQDFGRG